MDLKVIVSGIQLENAVSSTAETVGRTFFRAGAWVAIDPSYLSTIHGQNASEPAYYQVRIADAPIAGPGDEIADVLVALELSRMRGQLPLAATRCIQMLKRDGLFLYDSSFVGEVSFPDFRAVAVPANHIIDQLLPDEDRVKRMRIRNSVLVGALYELTGFDANNTFVAETLKEEFSTRKDILEKNFRAYDAGRQYVREHGLQPYHAIPQFPKPKQKRLFLTGNDALCISAIASGVGFYAGYPITPASPILEFLEKYSRELGIVVIQSEDEIAAAAAALGASYGGALSLTATSGPGFSLMVELIGHSGMTEIPLVAVLAQRAGPSTGMPTKTEQSDLMLAIFGHHGEIPKAVLAAGDAQECFDLMPRAFYLGRKYQMPIIIMSSLDIAEGWITIKKLNLKAVEQYDFLWKPQEKIGEGALHKRYAITESGISPIAIPGEPQKLSRVAGAEHDEYGYVATHPSVRKAMVDKRLRKLDTFLREDALFPKIIGPDSAEVTLIGWGSTKGAIEEARLRLSQDGVGVRTVHFIDLWPMRSDAVRRAIDHPSKIFVVEGNATGQLAMILRMQASEQGLALSPDKLISILRYDGRPMEPRLIVEKVREVMS